MDGQMSAKAAYHRIPLVCGWLWGRICNVTRYFVDGVTV
jgi:hypothetical protein